MRAVDGREQGVVVAADEDAVACSVVVFGGRMSTDFPCCNCREKSPDIILRLLKELVRPPPAFFLPVAGA
jgi:hypothetical protein